MKISFGIRIVIVSTINYLFGNTLFAFVWYFSQSFLKYSVVASLSTVLAAIFSYQTQSRYIFGRKTLKSFINMYYVSFQLLGLFLGILLVPLLALNLRVSIVVVQFCWSALFSLITLTILRTKKGGVPGIS